MWSALRSRSSRQGAPSHQLEDSAWSTINSRYSAIRSALDKIDSASELDAFSGATSSNPDAVTVSVTGATAAGTTSFTVDQLATNHQVASNSSFTAVDALVGTGDFTITRDGTDHTITTNADTTLAQLAADINALDIGVSASVISVDGTDYKLILSSDDTGDANTFTTSSTVSSLSTMDILQQGVDAQLTLGSGASALTLSRSSNTISDLIPGVTIDLKDTTTSAVNVTTQRDIDGTVDAISKLMDEINATLGVIAQATKYSPDSEHGRASRRQQHRTLSCHRSPRRDFLDAAVRRRISRASSVGIALNRDGTFDVDASKLREALETDFDAVVDLFVEGGSSTDSRVSFVASGDSTVEGSYDVVVTQAATKAKATSAAYSAPGSDSTFQIVVGSNTVDVSITTGMTVTEVVAAINDALTDAGVTSVTASETNVSGSDYIELNQRFYGSVRHLKSAVTRSGSPAAMQVSTSSGRLPAKRPREAAARSLHPPVTLRG